MIYVIGIGVDGRRSITERPLRIIENAGLVVGGKRHLDEFPDSAGKKLFIKGGLERVAKEIESFFSIRKAAGGRNNHVAVLATGDPSLYGIADFIMKRFGKRRVEIIPNVSVVQEAFARIKENMRGLKVLSAHGRSLEDGLVQDILSAEKAAIFTDPENTPEKIAAAMMDKGVTGNTVYVCSEIGLPGESVKKGTLEKIARSGPYPKLNTMVFVKDKKSGRAAPGIRLCSRPPGIPDKEFVSSTGMITKEEVRVVALSKLRLEEDSVVWDIGSGSGSVAVEASLLAPQGAVYAVEKNKTRVRDIKKNRARFGAGNLHIIEGVAPGCLASASSRAPTAPDAVFVGGGGKDLARILSLAGKKVRNGGRVVVNAVSLETASTAFEFFGKKGWKRELVLVSVSRSKSTGALNMLSAGNPVFIISGVRP